MATDARAMMSPIEGFSPRKIERRTDVEGTLRLLRKHKRTPMNVRGLVRCGLSTQQTLIQDLSDGGLGLAGADGLQPGAEVTVALITGEKRTGIVRWWLAGRCGIQFHLPLSAGDAFREAVIRRANAKPRQTKSP
jgi:hypothetical protein